MQYHVARMTPEELRAQLERAPLVILPVGTIEWHGPHLPIGLDAIKIEALAEGLAVRNGVAVAPAIYYGVCETLVPAKGFAGTLQTIERETFKSYIVQIGAGLRQIGFRALFILSGHYEPCQLQTLERAVAELRKLGLRARLSIEEEFTRHRAPGGDEDPPTDLTYRYRGGHAGEFETSLMLHVAPELVRMDAAPEELRIDLEKSSDGQRLPAHVRLSHPVKASHDQGAEIYDMIMAGGSAAIRELLQEP